MAQCKHFDICGLEGSYNGYCILHSPDLEKDRTAFDEALKQHQETRGHDYGYMVFIGEMTFVDVEFEKDVSFYKATFSEEADFSGATFSGRADFSGATFSEEAYFSGAIFSEDAYFVGATFSEEADFSATFSGEAHFIVATFSEEADFSGATFSGRADFSGATFSGETHFGQTVFTGPLILADATFLGRTLFAGPAPDEQADAPQERIFTGVEVDFTRVWLAPLDAVSFRNADLRKMRLLDTDVRKIEFTSVRWPEKNGKTCLYDETVYDHQLAVDLYRGEAAYNLPRVATAITRVWEKTVPWGKLERLYRELKQNHEDRKDYSQGGDFHYHEKEMQRLNPENRHTMRWWLLTLYRTFGGYGERVAPPLAWFLGLLLICTLLYLVLGVSDPALHSVQVSFLLRPDAPDTPELAAKWVPYVQTLQTIFSPILLGLLALAIRQRVKR